MTDAELAQIRTDIYDAVCAAVVLRYPELPGDPDQRTAIHDGIAVAFAQTLLGICSGDSGAARTFFVECSAVLISETFTAWDADADADAAPEIAPLAPA